jgi:hypothetical protein
MTWRAFGSNRAKNGHLEVSVQSTMKFSEDSGAVLIQIGDAEARYQPGEILAIRTEKIERSLVPTWRILLESKDGPRPLLSLGSESDALSVAEEIAKLGSARLIEHTGRIVERDEHGLTVLQQIARHPGRWPRPIRTTSMRGSVKVHGQEVIMDLPSEIPPIGFLFTALLLACSLILGPVSLLFSGNFIGFSQSGMSLGWGLGIFTSIILIAFLNRSNRLFEGQHRVIISQSGVSVSGKLLGLFRLPSETFQLSDFKDIDATQAWGLTLLFGDRRIRCDLPAAEGQCLIGEMIDGLREVGAIPFSSISEEE